MKRYTILSEGRAVIMEVRDDGVWRHLSYGGIPTLDTFGAHDFTVSEEWLLSGGWRLVIDPFIHLTEGL